VIGLGYIVMVGVWVDLEDFFLGTIVVIPYITNKDEGNLFKEWLS
jgi:hypothetical protein